MAFGMAMPPLESRRTPSIVPVCHFASPQLLPVHLRHIPGLGLALCTIMSICYDVRDLVSLHLPQRSHQDFSVRP
jgi:hypothetical protein